jgi:nucleotide-binding universal stress UspA family protein
MEVGDPADVIVRDAEAEQADEIVMGIRGTSRWTGLALGSVAYKVLHRAPIPVTIVPHPEEDGPAGLSADDVHRVLLAVDGSKHAARAVEYVCKLHGARNQLKVELLNAPLALPAPQGRARSAEDQEMLDKCNQEAGHATLRPASNALRAAGISFDTHIVPGNAAASIVQIAQTHRCTRIVMGTRGLGPLTGLILGSVAYTVVHLARIPVTLVK